MDVALKQLVGKRMGDPYGHDVYHEVDRVYCDGRLIGYISHKPGSNICFRFNYPERQRLEITRQVSMLRGGNPVGIRVVMPPPQDQIDEAMEKVHAAKQDEEDDD
jgi:hypothetical protein